MKSPTLLAAMLVLTGCSAAPRLFIPVRPIPESFSQDGADNQDDPEARRLPLPQRWWESLGDPALGRLIEQGLSGNLDLKSAWDRLTQSQAIARREASGLFLMLDGDAGGSYTRRTRMGETRSVSAGLSVGYEVDLWGRIRAGYESAKLEAALQREAVDATAITLSTRIATRWNDLAEARNQVALLERQIATNRSIVTVLRVRVGQGQATAIDLLRQQNLIEGNRGDMEVAKQRVRLIENDLAVLIGEAPASGAATKALKDGASLTLAPLPRLGVPSDVLRRRPDVRAAYRAVQSADRLVAEAVADRYPRVSLSGSIGTNGDPSGLFENWVSTLAANLVQPILDGGRRAAEVDRARAVTSEALHDYSQALLLAMQEVEDALVSEVQQERFLQSIDKQVETARKILERTRDSYANGEIDYIRVLDAVTSLQALERTQLQARRDRMQVRIDLCRAIAGGLDMESPDPARFNEPAAANARQHALPDQKQADTEQDPS